MKPEVIVVGASGHAKVCIELLQAMGEKVAFCVADSDSPEQCVGIPVLNGDANLVRLRAEGYVRLFVAIGSNELRSRLSDAAISHGYCLTNAISPHAIISPTAKLGVGVAVMAGAVINAESIIQDLVIINTGATIDHDCRIGKAAHIAPQCALAGNVSVGDRSFLGVGCKVIPGIEIGKGAVVGAGAVVISDVEAGVCMMGVPARVVRRLTKEET